MRSPRCLSLLLHLTSPWFSGSVEVHQIFPLATNPLCKLSRASQPGPFCPPTPHAISHCPRAGELSLAVVQLKTTGWVFPVSPWAQPCEAGGAGDTEVENIELPVISEDFRMPDDSIAVARVTIATSTERARLRGTFPMQHQSVTLMEPQLIFQVPPELPLQIFSS